MLKITPEGESGAAAQAYTYVRRRPLVGRLVLPLTRYLRAVNAERYMAAAERHLDIGCGDGYFLRRSECRERYGLDKLQGDEVTDHLAFEDNFFDYVTMLAVIEHLPDPGPVVAEVARVLKPGGRFVVTTPRRIAESLMKLYAREIDHEHERYYNRSSMEALCRGHLDLEAHHTFEVGLNQAFCMRKPLAGGSAPA